MWFEFLSTVKFPNTQKDTLLNFNLNFVEKHKMGCILCHESTQLLKAASFSKLAVTETLNAIQESIFNGINFHTAPWKKGFTSQTNLKAVKHLTASTGGSCKLIDSMPKWLEFYYLMWWWLQFDATIFPSEFLFKPLEMGKTESMGELMEVNHDGRDAKG